MKAPRTSTFVCLAAMLAATAVWLLAPYSLQLPPCAFKTLTGRPCVFCGGSRAAVALWDLRIIDALAWNPLMTLTMIGAGILLAIQGIRSLVGRNNRPGRAVQPDGTRVWALRPAALALGLVLGLSNWIYLLMGGR